MQKYGITTEQLAPNTVAAVRAAERSDAYTVIYREQIPVAAIVPMKQMRQIDSTVDGDLEQDPLLSLCGSCAFDGFVDSLVSDFGATMLFQAGTGGRRRIRPKLPQRRGGS